MARGSAPFAEARSSPALDALRSEFLRAWARAAGREAPVFAGVPVFDSLVARYREPWRAYHGLSHVARMLAGARTLGFGPERSDRLVLAIWFHDAVYVPGSETNERESAELWRWIAGGAGIPEATVDEVAEMILATTDHRTRDGVDVELQAALLDLDLAVFGAPAEEFAAYAREIRAEYPGMGEGEFRRRRAEVLGKYLGRARIYQTDALRERFEGRARENLRRVVPRIDPADSRSERVAVPRRSDRPVPRGTSSAAPAGDE